MAADSAEKSSNPVLICGILIAVIIAIIVIFVLASGESTDNDNENDKNGKHRKKRGKKGGKKGKPDVVVKVITLSADSWCGFCKKMASQREQIKGLCEKEGMDYKFISDLEDKAEFDRLSKLLGPKGFPHNVGYRSGDTDPSVIVPGYMPAQAFVERMKNGE